MVCRGHQGYQAWLAGLERKVRKDQPLRQFYQDQELKVTRVLQELQAYQDNLDCKDAMDLQALQVRKEILDCLVTVVYQDSGVRLDQQVSLDRKVNLELMDFQDLLA